MIAKTFKKNCFENFSEKSNLIWVNNCEYDTNDKDTFQKKSYNPRSIYK